MNILTSLKGYKTYVICAIALLLLLADYNGWFKVPPQIIAACGVVAVAALRSGVKTGADSDGDETDKAASANPPGIGSIVPLLICFAIFGCLLVSGVTGCKTGPPGSALLTVNTNGLVSIGTYTVNTNDVYNGLKFAAKEGAQAAIRYDANSREYLEAVDVVLTTALDDQNFDPDQINDALSNISIKEAHNPDVITGVQSAIAVYKAFFGNVVSQKIDGANVYLAPALTALRDGIRAAIPPVAPASPPPSSANAAAATPAQ